MFSHEVVSPRKRFHAGCASLAMLASACGSGQNFTATPAEPDGSMSGDTDGGVVLVIGPNGDAASPPEASAETGAAQGVVDATSDSPSCSSSKLECGGLCVPIDTSNCGACGTQCASSDGGTATCTEFAGTYSCGVACGGSLTHCGASCVDSQTDPNNCGRCGHSCVAGACVAGQCQSWVVTNTSTANAILNINRGGDNFQVDFAVDGTSVVWLDKTEGVLKVSATAGPSSPIATLSPLPLSNNALPGGLAMANGVVAWTMYNDNQNDGVSLWDAPRGAPGGLVVTRPASTATDSPSGLALDATGANAYFEETTDTAGRPLPSPGLFQCNLAGQTCALLHSVNPPVSTPFLVTPTDDVAMLGSRLFWTEVATGSVFYLDYSSNATGAAATNQDGPCLLALDSTYVYWANVVEAGADGGAASFSVVRTPQASPGLVTPVVSNVSGQLAGMGSDGTNLYFIQRTAPAQFLMEYVPVDGSVVTPRSLKDGAQPFAIAVGGGAIYWIDGDNTIDGIAAP
jgi:hypothetical protein